MDMPNAEADPAADRKIGRIFYGCAALISYLLLYTVADDGSYRSAITGSVILISLVYNATMALIGASFRRRAA